MKKKHLNVLITGAASGIGRAAAEYFIDRGHTVYGVDIADCGLSHSFVADVTIEASLVAVRAELSREGVIFDAILCIAGVHDMVSLVESDFTAIKRIIDVNLLGTALTCRTFHPLLAECGRFVILTSEVATYAPMPFNGIYNVSKTALECYAQALRQELGLLGQKVVTVRPGAVETPLASSSQTATARLAEKTRLYAEEAGKFSGLVAKFSGTPIKPTALAPLIYRATLARRPRLAYAKHRNIGLVLLSLLPKRMQCFIIRKILGR